MALCALMATATLTSCEGTLDDIFGEWDNPAKTNQSITKKAGSISYATTSQTVGNNVMDFVNPITIEGDGKVTYSSSDPTIAEVDPETGVITPHKAGTVTITATITDGETTTYETKKISYTLKVNYPYLKWDDATKKLVEADPLDETTADLMPAESTLVDGILSSKLLPGGTYIIAEDMTLDNTIRLSGDVDIILCDGKTLTFDASFFGSDGDSHKLNIYGQSENSGKIIVKQRMGGFEPLYVYGGVIEVGEDNVSDYNLTLTNTYVYGGKITAINHRDGNIKTVWITSGKLAIYGGEMIVEAQKTGDGTSYYCNGIAGDVEIHGGKLTVTSVKSYGPNAYAISGNLTVAGGTVSLYGGPTAGQDQAVSGSITAGAGVLEESDDETSWTTITSTSSTKHYIRTKP